MELVQLFRTTTLEARVNHQGGMGSTYSGFNPESRK